MDCPSLTSCMPTVSIDPDLTYLQGFFFKEGLETNIRAVPSFASIMRPFESQVRVNLHYASFN